MISADETTWVPPEAWRRVLQPRRGGTVVPPPAIDENASATVRVWLPSAMSTFRKIFDEPDTAPELVEAARAWIRGEANPAGAAAILTMLPEVLDTNPPSAETLVDAWIGEHGLVFAAEAAVQTAHVRLISEPFGQYDRRHSLNYWDVKAVPHGWDSPTMARLRALLAATDEQTYWRAVAALAEHRKTDFTKLMVSFMVPTEVHWVDELVATHPMTGYGNRLLWTLSSASTTAQIETLSGDPYFFWVFPLPISAYTVADGIGPALAPVIATELANFPTGATRQLLLAILAEFPTDEAFGILIERVGQHLVQLALLAAMNRYPRRALRLLGASAEHDETVARLFRSHVSSNKWLADESSLGDGLREQVAAVLKGADQSPEASVELLPPLLTNPPWTTERAKKKPVVLPGLSTPDEKRLVWLDGEQEALAA